MLTAAWWRKPSLLWLWTSLTTGGAITAGDLVVNAVFGMYLYRPGFLAKYPDNYLGVLFAECLFVPAYFALVSTLASRYRYLIYGLAVIPILLIELLFLQLGVYFHRTWTFWHSTIAFGMYSLAAAYLAGKFERQGYTRPQRLILIAATTLYAMNFWGVALVGVTRLMVIRLHLVVSGELDLVLSSLLLHGSVFALTGIIGTWYRLTHRRWFVVAAGAGLTLWVMLLHSWGVWTAKPPWTPWMGGLLFSLAMAGIGQLDRFFSARVQPPASPGGGGIPPWEPPPEAVKSKGKARNKKRA